jgi:hypothetical protein
MALQVNIPAAGTSFGIAAPAAYAKITSYAFDAESKELRAVVSIFADKAARDAKKQPIRTTSVRGTVGKEIGNIDEQNGGVRKALYTWLKTTPTFRGASDV